MTAASGNDARGQIMTRMRHALGRDGDTEAHAAVQERLSASSPTLVPTRADLDSAGRVQLFVDQAKTVQADVERIESYTDLPKTVAAYLRDRNLPLRLVKATDDWLDKSDWQGGLLETRTGRPGTDDAVGLSAAFAGIAETGTLMLTSDADHPTTLAFLPETAVVVLPTDRIGRAYEDALHAFRSEGRALPRSINLITGPSRSGDIEQTLQLGAHGPKRLLIVLVDEASGLGPIPDIETAAPKR